MRVLLLTDNFVPEINSPALRAYEHARRWVEAGTSVTVLTSIPNFPTGRPLPPYRNRLFQREILNGIHVVRVWTLLAPNRGVLLRSLDFLSFAATGFIAGLFQRADVIVATSPQLLTGLAGRWLAAAKGKPWIFEVRDLWPDSIVSVGVMQDNAFIRVLQRLENHLYRRATRVVAVSSGIRDRLIARGVPPEKIGVVPNGVDLQRLSGSKGEGVREALNLMEKFVVGYVGTHGMAQGLEVVVRSAAELQCSDTQFLMVGEGARREAVMLLARDLRLNNIKFIGLVPLNVAAEHLAACDVVLIPLKRTDQIEITIPGKIFEAAAMGKPMIVCAEGASADLVQRYGAGLVVPPEDPQALTAAIDRLRGDPELRARLGEGARRLARDFDRERLAGMMLTELRHAMSHHQRPGGG